MHSVEIAAHAVNRTKLERAKCSKLRKIYLNASNDVKCFLVVNVTLSHTFFVIYSITCSAGFCAKLKTYGNMPFSFNKIASFYHINTLACWLE